MRQCGELGVERVPQSIFVMSNDIYIHQLRLVDDKHDFEFNQSLLFGPPDISPILSFSLGMA